MRFTPSIEMPIESWFALLNANEANLLYSFIKKLPKDSIVVEIGSALGGSSSIMATANPEIKITSIDPFIDLSPLWAILKDTYDKFTPNSLNNDSFDKFKQSDVYNREIIDKLFIEDPSGKAVCDLVTKKFSNINIVRGFSPNDFSEWDTEIDVYFEDSIHDNPGVHNNLSFWCKKLKPKGYLIGHDYIKSCHGNDTRDCNYPDIVSEFNKLIGQGWDVIAKIDTLIILQKPDSVNNVEEINVKKENNKEFGKLSPADWSKFPVESQFIIMTWEEYHAMYGFAKTLPNNSVIIEVGSALGGTACLIASANPTFKVHSIDSFEYEHVYEIWNRAKPYTEIQIDNWNQTQLSSNRVDGKKWVDNINALFSVDKSGKLVHDYITKSYNNITQHVGISPTDFSNWNTMVDVYIEDSLHTNPTVHSNLEFWKKFVKPGGYIVGHDYEAELYPDVFSEFNELIRMGWKKVSLTVNLIILQKPLN